MSNAEAMLGNIKNVREHSGWFVALGVIFIIGGAFAIALPLIATLAATLAVGWALIFVGIMQLVHSWGVRPWGGFIWQVIIGLIILAGGVSVLFDPIVGALSLTLLLGAVFIAKGIMQLILGFQYRPHANWGWIVAAGAIAVVLGVVIVAQWPVSAAWVPGTLAGVSLIFSGWSYIMLTMAARETA